MTDSARDGKTTLVLGGTGKTGRRVADRLRARAVPVRVGSRSGEPPFDWEDRSTWALALDGVGSAAEHGVPGDVIDLLTYLFDEVLDGRNAHLSDGVQRALGREPRDYADYARDAAASGVWNPSAVAA